MHLTLMTLRYHKCFYSHRGTTFLTTILFTGFGYVSLTPRQAWVVVMHLNHSKLAPTRPSNRIANVGREEKIL